jgi:hypothetical protein
MGVWNNREIPDISVFVGSMPDLVYRVVRTETISMWWIVSGHHHNSTAVGLLVKYQCFAICVGFYQQYLVALNYTHS